MTVFGPHVRYTDPRIYGLVAGYAWGPHQREMLLGTRPWSCTRNMISMTACLMERGIRVGRDVANVARLHMDGLPDRDDTLDERLAERGIAIPRVSVLSLLGPVEEVGTVPIFQAVVFGYVEHADGKRRHGLNADAWIVGRMDVRRTYRITSPWEWSQAGEPVTRFGGVRGTPARARNTARELAAAIPDWDEYCVWKARKDAEADEAARRAAAALEPVDDGLLDVTF